ncbi:MAG: right-handed parallel beta-helix repeat-containing protein, partial [Myxococcota bacterium]|nr:right-handed parallel beta-helix repeat-containing protein [Myxococcota bacterium]
DLVILDAGEGSSETGIDMEGGLTASWTLSGLTVKNARGMGIHQSGGSLTLDSVVGSDNGYVGLYTVFGNMVATGCTFRDNDVLGVVMAGMDGTMEDCLVAGNRTDETDGFGWGITVEDGSTLLATNTTVEGNQDAGVVVHDSAVVFEGCQVQDNLLAEDGMGGWGFEVADGGTLLATDTRIEGNAGAGVWLEEATATLVGCAVLENRDSGVLAGASDVELDH